MPSQTKPKSRKGDKSNNTNAAQFDPRFASIASDPRYRLPSARHSRVNVDNRFAGMFKDEEFSKKASVDRYGRKVAKGTGKKELEKFYRLEGEGEDGAKGKGKGKREVVGSDEESDEEEDEEAEVGADDDDEVQAELDRVERKGARDYAREGGFSDSSSDEDSSSAEESDEEDEDEAAVVEFPDEEQAPEVPLGEVSKRLAVVNLDWDNIRAADLLAVAQSFAPGGKGVQRVVVYPSEFGRERMEREELEGPPREIFASTTSRKDQDSDEDEDSEEEEERIKKQLLQEDTGEEFDSARLRQYQLDRLKYYYAVITCDNEATAKAVYDDMDGREYLTTANFFDLRFVPDDVSFDTDIPRDECSKLSPGYKPNEFVTSALTHSNVKLTWDADDTTRKEVQKRAFSRAEIDENDLQAYIGSDSDSDDEDAAPAHAQGEDAAPKLSKAEQQRQRMRAALGLASLPAPSNSKDKKTKESAPVGDMQITFSSGLAGSKKDNSSIFENDPATVNETTRERYIRKEKERKQKRKEKAKAVRAGLDPDAAGAVAESDEEQAQAGEEANEDLGFNDPFFTDAPAAQRAEKEARRAEKAKKRLEREEADAATAAQRAELELLMVDDKADASMRHFNMNEIAKAEKLAKRKGKKGGKKGEAAKVDGEDFEIQTEDPRFKGLFESHEFAIDPTNPRFQNTAGMKALLEEGRKKRKVRGGDEDGDGEVEERREKKSRKEKGAEDEGAGGDGDDLQKLLARVKAKGKQKK